MRYKLKLRLLSDYGVVFFGPGVMDLAERIDRGLSLRQAAQEMGMAYSKAWRIVNEVESAIGVPLLSSQRGGNGGGGSTLTPEGKALMEGYREFVEKATGQCDRLFEECLAGRLPPEEM